MSLIACGRNRHDSDAPDHRIAYHDRVVPVIAQLLALLLRLRFQLLSFSCGLLLGFLSGISSLAGCPARIILNFVLEARRLGFGLDGLVLVVGGDGGDVGAVDVD